MQITPNITINWTFTHIYLPKLFELYPLSTGSSWKFNDLSIKSKLFMTPPRDNCLKWLKLIIFVSHKTSCKPSCSFWENVNCTSSVFTSQALKNNNYRYFAQWSFFLSFLSARGVSIKDSDVQVLYYTRVKLRQLFGEFINFCFRITSIIIN